MPDYQSGSIIGRFWKLAKFLWLNICKSAKFSLTGIKKAFHWLMKLDLLKILKCIKLIIEITHSLLFCKQPQILLLLGNWDNDKSYVDL